MNKRSYRFVFVDVVMVVLLIANLVLIVFDWLYNYEPIAEFWDQVLPGFSQWYATRVHPRFILIDLVFVAIFLTDFVFGWIVAVANRTHHRWFFYPFIHWYDLLGCIPVSGFRFLRLLRIVTVVYRLHRSGAVDLSDSGPARLLRKYYAVAVEEVTDRVSIRMLSDVQQEVKNGGPLVDKIVAEVIRPRQAELVEWLSERMSYAVSKNLGRYRESLDTYLQARINTAMYQNPELARLRRVPMVGPAVLDTAKNTISQIVSDLTHGILEDLASRRNRRLVSEATELTFDALLAPEEDEELNRMVTETVDRSIEIVKQQVAVQQWKIRDLAEDEQDVKRLLRQELDRMDTPGSPS
jgi:hypothetical protein